LHRNCDKRNQKKERSLQSINTAVLEGKSNFPRTAELVKVEEVEADEMWSFVGKKQNQRWLWHAIDHETGEVLAYVLGQHQDSVLLQLKTLLEPFGISHFFTDGWGGYERHIKEEQLSIGKENTQKIERKHLTLRTRIKRLARKTICFSKSEKMHDIVLGLFINRYEFGLAI
jgi:insertion element IS1 protein InsB